jgi:hypothetical protein
MENHEPLSPNSFFFMKSDANIGTQSHTHILLCQFLQKEELVVIIKKGA